MNLKRLTIRIDCPPNTPGDLADAIEDIANAIRSGRIPNHVKARLGVVIGDIIAIDNETPEVDW